VALDHGERPRSIALRLEVSRVWVHQVCEREQKAGKWTSFQIGGHRRSQVAEMEPALRACIEAEPDLALSELSERLANQGVLIKPRALWHQLNKWNLTLRNPARRRARTRGRTESATNMVESLPAMNIGKLVFIDETCTSTRMTRRCGRAPKDKRCIASAPLGHWKTIPSWVL
jgi:transposase